MARNVRLVKGSEKLRDATAQLAERALDFWRVIDAHRAELAKPMERAGRKAQRLLRGEEEAAP